MGKIATKLQKLLEAEGFEVLRLEAAQGPARQNPQYEFARWGAIVRKNGEMGAIDCHDTMTKCVKQGLYVTTVEHLLWEVYARDLI